MAGAKYYGRNTKAVTNALDLAIKTVNDARIIKDYPMSSFTTFKTGGSASLLIRINKRTEFIKLLEVYNRNSVEFIILGNGSNILVSDNGIRLPVLIPDFNNILLQNDTEIYAEAGCLLKTLSNFAANHSLSGLEFAAGIPGTVGGGIIMNAGAYGGELKDCVISVDVWNRIYGQRAIDADEAEFSYRHSVMSDSGDIVLGALFKLKPADDNMIYSKMIELSEKRRSKQPLNLPSAGSTFKRPKNGYAAALIERCGLKGANIGDAEVSQKHAGFIVNTGAATSTDIYKLIKYVIETVRSKTGIELEPEIKFIGDF